MQGKGGDQEYTEDYHEEQEAGDHWHMPQVWDEGVPDRVGVKVLNQALVVSRQQSDKSQIEKTPHFAHDRIRALFLSSIRVHIRHKRRGRLVMSHSTITEGVADTWFGDNVFGIAGIISQLFSQPGNSYLENV